jgi:hypothetical protein
MNNQNTLNEILDALAVSNIETGKTEPEKKVEDRPEYNEDEELAKTLQEMDELIESNALVLDEAKRLVESTGDSNYIIAYSTVGKTQGDVLKGKLKLIMDKAKNRITEQTNKKNLEIKERLADFTTGGGKVTMNALPGTTLNQTNVIMSGSREEMYEMLIKLKERESIDKITESLKEIPPIDV